MAPLLNETSTESSLNDVAVSQCVTRICVICGAVRRRPFIFVHPERHVVCQPTMSLLKMPFDRTSYAFCPWWTCDRGFPDISAEKGPHTLPHQSLFIRANALRDWTTMNGRRRTAPQITQIRVTHCDTATSFSDDSVEVSFNNGAIISYLKERDYCFSEGDLWTRGVHRFYGNDQYTPGHSEWHYPYQLKFELLSTHTHTESHDWS
jgi:hypothetical protein